MLPAPPVFLAPLLDRPAAVFGAGVSGQGVLSLLEALGVKGVTYDEKAAGAERAFTARVAEIHPLVIYSPGFAQTHPWLQAANAAGCTCLGELDFASLFWRGELLAVTGTNGKTTLAEFLTHALNQAGRRAACTGNVGYSFSRFVAEQSGRVDLAVCEVSSFQAETLQHLRPTATLWTNFAEDHLERHAGMDDYFAAKWRLVERTPSGAVFVGSSVQTQAQRLDLRLPTGSAIATENQPADARLAGTVFAGYPQLENFLLAAAWWRQSSLPEEALFTAARAFQLGQHRMTRVGEKNGITFWNDSKATNFHAVEAALTTMAGPVLWIGGGRAKGGDLGGFIRRIARRIRHAFLIGETAPVLAGHCREFRVPVSVCGKVSAKCPRAFALAVAGDAILLSPGFASFDMFRGYEDRGRQFEQLVENL